jgi:hypothetical protein
VTPRALFSHDALMKRNLVEKAAKGTGRLAKKAAPNQPENSGNAPRKLRLTPLNRLRKIAGQGPL